MKIKKGDKVIVVAGKDKGKKSTVIKAMPKKDKVVVKDANIRKKFIKKSGSRPGEIIDIEAPLDVSNVMIEDPKDGKATRVGYKVDKDGKKKRFSKRTGELIPEPNFKK